MGDDESKFRDAVRGLAEAQEASVEAEERRMLKSGKRPRDKLLEMIGDGEEDVATLRKVIKQKDEKIAANQVQYQQNITAKDEKIAANQVQYQQNLTAKVEEIALLKAQLQKLQQPPKEGVPPV